MSISDIIAIRLGPTYYDTKIKSKVKWFWSKIFWGEEYIR